MLNYSGHNCVTVGGLNDCKLKHLHRLADLFNMCLKESCFPGYCRVSSAAFAFKIVGETFVTE